MDTIDQISKLLDQGHSLAEVIQAPALFKNSKGEDLFGFPVEEMARASFYYRALYNVKAYPEAESFIEQLELGINIEKAALAYEKAVLGNARQLPYYQPGMSCEEVLTCLYADFEGISPQEMHQRLNAENTYGEQWKKIVPEEDKVTPEQLGEFYSSLPFPVGSSSTSIFKNKLSMAYRYLPVDIVNQFPGIRSVFDFGGNSGDTLVAILNNCLLDQAVLIEGNQKILDFAKWRDRKLGLKPITSYLLDTHVSENVDQYAGTFDFGISTEVLEHVWDVHEVIDLWYKLIKTDGLMLMSSSFGYYPFASHLQKNIVYAGKEEQLMREHGFIKLDYKPKVPYLNSTALYKRV